ncbi:MAG: hypothetical protein L0Z63_07830, partial [Actinobacteria bacterium]|nr:hypothetical protein [Actinomycetota bacterium]
PGAHRDLDPGPAFVRIGVLVTGDTAVRAAHSLAAHPGVDEVVVVGPANSKTFRVVDDAQGCDLLVGTGPEARRRARELGVDLVWDGETSHPGVRTHGAESRGIALAVAARESDPQLVAVAHPALAPGEGRLARFPRPVGRVALRDEVFSGRRVAVGHSPNTFASALVVGARRRVTIVDEGAFLSGVALAAGCLVTGPVWDEALTYLRVATEMGVVMAEELSVEG